MQGTSQPQRLDVRLEPAGMIVEAETSTVAGVRTWKVGGLMLSDSEAQSLFDEMDKAADRIVR